MLADGYRMQAEQILAQAQAAQGTDQETELLEKSRDTFTQAIGLYRDAGSFADAKANMAAAAQELRGILSRLEELGSLPDAHGRDPQHRRRPPAAGDLDRAAPRTRRFPVQGLPGDPAAGPRRNTEALLLAAAALVVLLGLALAYLAMVKPFAEVDAEARRPARW